MRAPARRAPAPAGVPGPPVVSCERLVHIYRTGPEQVVALRGVDLSVRAGETVALLGPSGAGKSTLLTLLAGLAAPTAGSLHVLGQDMSRLSERRRLALRRRGVGLLLQNPGRNLLGWATVADNVAFAQQAGRGSRRAARRRGRDLLEAVGLSSLRRRPARELSGGEQQRLALAVALSNGPDLLLADEPTSQLDHETGRQILDLVLEVQRDLGTTVVVVTHDPEVGAVLGRTVTIADGRVGAHGRGGREFAVVDRQGGLQLTPQALERLPPGSRLTMHPHDDGVLLRPAPELLEEDTE